MESRELTSRVTGLSTDLVRELMITMQFTQELDSLDVLMRGLDLWSDEKVAEPPDEPDIPPDVPPPPPPAPRSDEPTREGETQEVDPDAVAADIELFLNDIIFNPDNLEIDSADNAVFLLSGAVLCDPEAYGPKFWCEPRPCDPRDTRCQEDGQKFVEQCKQDEASAQAECRARIDALEIRVAVVAEGSGADIQVRIGPEGDTPVKFSVQPDRIEAEVNLAEIKDVVVRIAEVIGEQEPLELPEVMDGKFSLSLIRTEAGKFTLQNSILTDVRVLMPLPEEGNLEINIEQANPLGTLVIDGTNEQIEASWDLNRVDVSFPFGSRFESGTGNFLIEIAGIEGHLAASVADDTVRLTGLGLGDTTSRVLHDQVVLASVDLNPDSGRHFDLSVSPVGDMPLFSFSDLSLDVFVNLGHLDPYLGVDEEPAPFELRDQTYRLQLVDAGLLPVEGPEEQEDMLKVLTGSLSLSSTASEATIEAQAGQCLMRAEACPEEAHAVLECMSVFDCP
jgi:hypothetical protein